jgi:hypothetical protein
MNLTIANHVLNNSWKSLFLLSFIFITSWIVISCPSLSTHAEVWAETGTNFIQNATEKGILENLLIKDSSYLPIFNRIIAVTVITLYGTGTATPYILNSGIYLQILSLFVHLIGQSLKRNPRERCPYRNTEFSFS